jgi:hypothetical protein
MSVNLTCKLSDRRLDRSQSSNQRQLAIAVSASASVDGSNTPPSTGSQWLDGWTAIRYGQAGGS